MVIIEFFAEAAIDNMIAALANRPETVVFVGDLKAMKKQETRFRRFLEAVGNTQTRILFRGVKSHDFNEIVQVLEQLVREYPGCHIDITGGEDMALTAVGTVYERHRDSGIQLHQYNVRTGKVYDCDLDGITPSGDIPPLTVAQSIILHGGSVISKNPGDRGPDADAGSFEDILSLWDICKTDCPQWNSQLAILNNLRQYRVETGDPLEECIPVAALQNAAGEIHLGTVVDKLANARLLRLSLGENLLCIRYKNDLVKYCLEKSGTILELYTCAVARSIRLKNGQICYQDALSGVFIDWDGVPHDSLSQEVDTENEIDVILIRGVVPVFISCKNGVVEETELYKLCAVADRFGGRYVRKALVATTLGNKSERSRQHFQQRAEDMGVTLISGVHEMSSEEFAKALRLLT